MNVPGGGSRKACGAVGAALAAFLALSACTIIRPLDYLSDGPPDAGAVEDAAAADVTISEASHGDATQPQGDGNPLDAPGDGRDSSAPQDSSTSSLDAGTPDADASVGTWCQQNAPLAFLCADFDESSLTKVYGSGTLGTITGPVMDPGGTAILGSGPNALSPPGSFLAETDATDGGTIHVRFEQPAQVMAGVQAADLRFDMRLATYTVGQEIDLAILYMPSTNGAFIVRSYLLIGASGEGVLDVDDGGSGGSTTTFVFPADGLWHNYRLTTQLDPTVVANVYVDDPNASGAPAAQLTLPSAFSTSSLASFFLGVSVYGPSAAVAIPIDNAVFNAQ